MKREPKSNNSLFYSQVFYSLQPVWAATFAAAFLGEEIAPVGYAGGAIVLLATYIAGKEKMQKM